jgi:hypothetical protein
MGKPPTASNPARDFLTRNWAKKVAQKLESLLPNKPNEADLRHAFEPLFDGFCVEAGIPPLAHAEFSLASGTADAVFSRFIIEDKRLAELSMQAHELARTPAGSEPPAVSWKPLRPKLTSNPPSSGTSPPPTSPRFSAT